MSADNVVGIGKFPTKDGGFEYRVAEFTNSEDHSYSSDTENDWTDLIVFLAYCESKVYMDKHEARDVAFKLEKSLDICEYGVNEFDYTKPFMEITKEEALKRINDFWEKLKTNQINQIKT